MRLDTLGIICGTKAQFLRQAERIGQADRDRFAVNQPVAKAGFRLQRVGETMPKVEQYPPPVRFAFVLLDDAALAVDAGAERTGERRRIAGQHGLSMLFEPRKKGLVLDQRIFDDLDVARAQVARIERRKVGSGSTSTKTGWWNAPTRFLPAAVLDPGFPARPRLSTWASRLVGTWMRLQPRFRIAAAKRPGPRPRRRRRR